MEGLNPNRTDSVRPTAKQQKEEMMNIEKLSQGQYRISDGNARVDFDKERYEDLFYAVPVDTTAFYRLLTESVCETDDERKAMVGMIEGLGDMEKGLQDLQEQIVSLGND
jgi:hypothetical protein